LNAREGEALRARNKTFEYKILGLVEAKNPQSSPTNWINSRAFTATLAEIRRFWQRPWTA